METCLEYTDKTMWISTDEKWLKVSPPKRVNMTEEQRKAPTE